MLEGEDYFNSFWKDI